MKAQEFAGKSKSVSLGPRGVLLLGAIFLLIGLVTIAIAVALALNSRDFYATASQADGVVVDVHESWSRDSSGRSDETYCPIVEFTADGSRHQFRDHVCSSSNDPAVGDSVTVAFQSDDPDNARIMGSWFRQYLGALITGPLGVLFSGIGALLMIFSPRARSRSTR